MINSNKEEDEVAMPTGVYLRGSKWQLRVLVPRDLQALYGAPTRHRASLDTSDRREARVKALKLLAEFEAEFAQRRREANPKPVNAGLQALRGTLAAAVYAADLARDQAERSDKPRMLRKLDAMAQGAGVLMLSMPDGFDGKSEISVADQVLSHLQGRHPLPAFTLPPGKSPLTGLTPIRRQARSDLNERRVAAVAEAVSGMNLDRIVPLADLQAKRLGLSITWESPDGLAALEACLEAYSRARTAAIRRDSGEHVETPALPAPESERDTECTPTDVPASSKRTLEDVVPHWARYRRAKPNAVQRTNYALRLLALSGQAAPLADLKRKHGREFHAWLSEDDRGLTDKTAKNHIDCIRSLLQVATVELIGELGQLEVVDV